VKAGRSGGPRSCLLQRTGGEPAAVCSENRRTRKRSLTERGQAPLELALVVPMLVVLIFGMVEFGWALRSWITVTNAAQEGARIGAAHGAPGTVGECTPTVKSETVGDMPTIAASACTTAAALGEHSATVAVAGADPDGPGGPVGADLTGNSVLVTLAYRHDFRTPLGSLVGRFTEQDCNGTQADLCLSATADMRLD